MATEVGADLRPIEGNSKPITRKGDPKTEVTEKILLADLERDHERYLKLRGPLKTKFSGSFLAMS